MPEASVVIIPALFIGGLIGIVELFFVHADETGMGWLGHGLHAIPATILFTFISMNIGYVLALIGNANLVGSSGEVPVAVVWGVRIFIAIVAMLKVSAAAAIIGRVGEKFPHTLMIGALILAAPFFWDVAGVPLTNAMPFLNYRLL